jgi:glycine/D-amino acid oxidase-like deaminating enzyme
LPFQPVKGEILTLRSQKPLSDAILNAGHWLIPLDEHHYRLGSTYQHQPLDNEATDQGQQQLLRALGKLIKDSGPLEVVGHRAGVRPATRGTQPFLGPSPQEPRIEIFNGFGAKGSLLIPWYAERYTAYLQGRESLPPEADIRRFAHVTPTTDG